MQSQKIKLSICVPFYGRHELLKKTLAGLLRHKDDLSDQLIIQIFVAGDAPEIKRFCAYNRIEYTVTPNNPLGLKFNRVVAAGARSGDYIMILGSDAFLSPDYFTIALKLMKKDVPAMAADQVIFVCGKTLDARLVRSEPLGSGLCFSKKTYEEVIKKHTGLYRNELNKGLDFDAFSRLREAGNGMITPMVGFSPIILEVKTDENIWKFSNFEQYPLAYMDEFEHYFTRHDMGAIRTFHRIHTYIPI